MRDNDLFQLALGITSPWLVAASAFDAANKRLDIELDFVAGERFYPEIEGVLADLAKIAIPIVATQGKRGAARPYSFSYAKRIVREVRRRAGLAEHITMTACRHGGMTELGDAELTEQGVMSLLGHRTPDAARGYVKMTDAQRLGAARKRRAWVMELEHFRNESQNEPRMRESK